MKKQWVIPDIHGCSKTLIRLIEDQIQPTQEDELFFLGDYIDRGPDSKGVIDYLISLEEKGYHIKCLKGNHEEYLLKAYENEASGKNIFNKARKNKYKEAWIANGGDAFLNNFEISNLNDLPPHYIEWMKQLKYYLELPDYILVHAGLNFNTVNPFEDKSAMLWIRDFKVVPEKINHRKLIHGHIPVNIEFIELSIRNENYHFIDLDNGVYMKHKEGYGKLTAFEMGSKTLLSQDNLDH